jgi:hypothetical protein
VITNLIADDKVVYLLMVKLILEPPLSHPYRLDENKLYRVVRTVTN